MKNILFALLFGTMLIITGCGTFRLDGEMVSATQATQTAVRSTADAQAEGTTAVAPTTASDPTPLPEPTPQPTESPALLPAPLYYVDPGDQQLWRAEIDGETLTPITNEPQGIDAYDVNPVDGSLVYLSGNNLYLSDALGKNRQEIVAAPTQEEGGVHWYLYDRVSRPVWTPDGTQIYYGKHGINAYDPATGESRMVLLSDSLPAEGEEVQRPVWVHEPYSVSPDGAQLLVMSGWYQSGGGWPQILRLNTAAPLIEIEGEGNPCCNFAWSQDSATIYSANYSIGMFSPGFWRTDAATGQTEAVIPNPAEAGNVHLFGWPFDTGTNNEVYIFHGQGPESAYLQGEPHQMRLAKVNAASGEFLSGREEQWVPIEAAWLPDGSGVAIVDVREAESSDWPLGSDIYYLPVDGSDAFRLPHEGRTIHWGLMPS